ncbi:MAG TPA: S16 family serine protease [Symbiobacteriaceae bacterium]
MQRTRWLSRLGAWFAPSGAWALRLLAVVAGVGVLFSVLWFIPTPYYITAPGAAIDTSRLITTPGGEAHRGRLYMLVLNTDRANLLWYLEAKVDHRSSLETKEQFLGNVPDYDKYLELTRQMMADSQKTAKAIALHQLGYGLGVQAVGAEITDLGTGSPVAGLLQKGDVIVEAGGKPVRNTADLTTFMKGISPGTKVDLRLRRNGQELSLTVPTIESAVADRKGTAAFVIFIKDSLLFDLPVDVEIQPGAVTGPSAGLMFTLQIIDQMTPGGITGNRVIAGTGTIEANGSIGPIGGIQQKVYTAEAAGASVMFVPRGNYADAQKVATRVELVPVDTYGDALTWLQQHR